MLVYKVSILNSEEGALSAGPLLNSSNNGVITSSVETRDKTLTLQSRVPHLIPTPKLDQ